MSALLLFSTTMFGKAPKGGKLHETHVARSVGAEDEPVETASDPARHNVPSTIAFEQKLRQPE